MNTEEAIRFLDSHSPMQDDELLSQEDIDTYDEVRQFFAHNPDERCILPLLKSYGRWDCFGIYQRVEDVFQAFSADQMRGPLLEVLNSPHESVRYWTTQVSALFPVPELVPGLRRSLSDTHSDIRMVAAQALESCEATCAIDDIRSAREKTDDEDELEMYDEILETLENRESEQGSPADAGQ